MKRIAFLVAQRLGLGLISLFVVTLFIASGVELLPGDLAETLLGQSATPETVAAFRKLKSVSIFLFISAMSFGWAASCRVI